MDDDEILAHYKARDPFITAAQAIRLHRIEQRFGHLGRLKLRQDQQDQHAARRELRERLFGAYEHE